MGMGILTPPIPGADVTLPMWRDRVYIPSKRCRNIIFAYRNETCEDFERKIQPIGCSRGRGVPLGFLDM
jgi:hypothetical protein